ncbi:hypothetical protein KSW81_002854 [Nannochloris sp. 'desiccata']|nr:hypothetical protein KSW81_002854 [Chlorella desiccata (nom. nud.)]
MTQLQEDRLAPLKEAVAGLPSGNKLIAALEAADNSRAAPVELITSVVIEAKSQSVNAAAAAARVDLSNATSLISQMQFISPRGKFDVAFLSDRFVLNNAKTDVVVPYEVVENIIILDAIPKDTKGKVQLYFHLNNKAKVISGKKTLSAIVLQVLATQELSMDHPTIPGQKLEGAAAVVLCQAFGAVLSPRQVFAAPNAELFTSSEGHAAVQTTIKVSQGNLFPLAEGLCFLETPATFIPLSVITSVEFARANGASSTFDFYIHFKHGDTMEFSTISRSELPAIENYVRSTQLAVGPPAASSDEEEAEEDAGDGSGKRKGGAGADAASDSDDPDDEDFNPVESSDNDEEDGEQRVKHPKKKKHKKESAAAAAGVEGPEEQIDDIEEEEEEEEEDEDSDSTDSSESDSSDDDGSVEIVSEDEFSMSQLQNMMKSEKSRGGARRGAAESEGEDEDAGPSKE